MKPSKNRDKTILIFCCTVAAFVVLCVGLFFAAAKYAAKRPVAQDSFADMPATDTETIDVTTSSGTDVNDPVTDTVDIAETDAVLPDNPHPNYGEEFSTSPLPQWSFQYLFTEKVVEIARNEPAEAEDSSGVTKYGTYFGDPSGQWCTEFAVWCVIQAQEALGVEYINVYYPKSDYSGGCIQWYKKRNNYYPKGAYIPRRGDMSFFEYDGDGTSDHTGLVTGVEYDEETQKLYVLTIEGNLPEDYPTGVIRERRLAVDDKLIFGYGTFRYEPQPLPPQGELQ